MVEYKDLLMLIVAFIGFGGMVYTRLARLEGKIDQYLKDHDKIHDTLTSDITQLWRRFRNKKESL